MLWICDAVLNMAKRRNPAGDLLFMPGEQVGWVDSRHRTAWDWIAAADDQSLEPHWKTLKTSH